MLESFQFFQTLTIKIESKGAVVYNFCRRLKQFFWGAVGEKAGGDSHPSKTLVTGGFGTGLGWFGRDLGCKVIGGVLKMIYDFLGVVLKVIL